MIKGLIYVRVSSRRQEEEGHGLESQEAICRDLAERKGLPVVAVFTDTYTGGSIKRSGLDALLKYVRLNKSTKFVVIFDDISRLTRSLEGHLKIREQLRNAGCLLLSPGREFSDDADSMLIENILASMAEHQRRKNAEQVRSRMKGRLLGGQWPFRLPYGLKRTKVPGGGSVIVADEPHFSIVQEALLGFADGRFANQGDLSRWLSGRTQFTKSYRFRSVTYSGSPIY